MDAVTPPMAMGAYQQSIMPAAGCAPGWHQMATAPRDGTPVEIMNSYGVAPTYGLFRWAAMFSSNTPSWVGVDRPNTGLMPGDDHYCWRPYTGDPAAYVDPTNGMQADGAYWRGAIAAKNGLPLDAFEAMAARNERANARASHHHHHHGQTIMPGGTATFGAGGDVR